MFGRCVPMVAMSHQYLLTESIPELEAWCRESGRKLPLLRDVDTSWYLRQEKFGLNLGPYERGCRAHWVTADDPMPEDFSFQLYPDDLERLEWYVEDAIARVPLLGEGGVSRVINGPIPYTPDGNPLIGPMPGVPDAFEACVFTFGIRAGGGRRQGACAVGGRRRYRMGHVELRPPPVHGTMPTRTTRLRRRGRSTATSTRCTSPTTPGRPGATSGSRRCMTASGSWGGSSEPTAAGSARTGSHCPGTTPRSRPRRPGPGKVPGSPASARSASRCAMPRASSTSRGSAGSTCAVRARRTGSGPSSPARFRGSGASVSSTSRTIAAAS